MERVSEMNRETKETKIKALVNLDGSGESSVSTGLPFFDHMLELMAKNALIDLNLDVDGDLEVDGHHTVEDAGLVLGNAILEALGNKEGICRYGWSLLPMDESLARVGVDISGRPFLRYDVELPVEPIGNFDPTLVEDFFQAMVNESRITLHVKLLYGTGMHHGLEAVFKAVGRSLRQAVSMDPRVKGVPSTKGSL